MGCEWAVGCHLLKLGRLFIDAPFVSITHHRLSLSLSSPRTSHTMSAVPSTSTSHSNFASIFNAALEKYKHKTKQDLAKHPLLPRLQSCDSPEAIFTNGDDGLTTWVTPTVNVLYSFSATIGGVVGLGFPPANIIFTGIGVLLLAAKDARASRDKLIDLFNCIERFFQRIEIYTGITPTMAMTNIIVDIMVEVLTILAIATKEVKRGRLKRYFRKLVGNTDIEDSLQRLDRLTQEEARMASAELLKVTHSVDDKVMGVDDRVRDIEGKVEDVQGDVHDVGDKVQDVDNRVQGISRDVREANRISSEIVFYDGFRRQIHPSITTLPPKFITTVQPNGFFKAKYLINGNHWFILVDTWKACRDQAKVYSGSSFFDSFYLVELTYLFSSSIIQDIMACAMRDGLDGLFYFDFKDIHKQKLHNLLPSLLTQLSARSTLLRHTLPTYSAHDRGEKQPSDRLMVECLKEMLILLDAQGPTYIILDALDECPKTSTIPPPREEVLDFVEELVGLHFQIPHMRYEST
ncbi:hypothetical protein BGY98DRAFT_1192114 [Russula aff. rugulosa BPL654]|nr:hypothetical protein BGY98DRAFT_1192114 [Russula aff. rugulosa BPL654]